MSELQAKELRIGNIINDTSFEDLPIEQLKKDGEFWEVKVEGYDDFVHLDDCSPILITEEWLIRFGFEKIDFKHRDGSISKGVFKNYPFIVEVDRLEDNNFRVCRIVAADNKIYNFVCFCKYVHQLQNIYFALTGQELQLY